MLIVVVVVVVMVFVFILVVVVVVVLMLVVVLVVFGGDLQLQVCHLICLCVVKHHAWPLFDGSRQ